MKKKIDLEESAIARYWHQIDSGAIVACKEIRTVYQHLYRKLYDSTIDAYHYDWQLAHRPVEFIETFVRLPKVRGNPLCRLDLWQLAMIESIFGFVDNDGIRQYAEVFFTVARKQGKSALAAMIALYLLICDGESEPELYCVATKRDQSKIIWEMASQIMSKSPELREYLKKRVADISCSVNNGIFKPLASDSNSLDGLNASTVFCDEIHAWKDSNLYDVMVDSMVARTQPLLLITTTAGFVREGIYDQKVDEYEMIIAGYDDTNGYKDPRRLPIIYKLDSEKEWTKKKSWIKANPGLGTIRDEEKLAEDVERAKSNPLKVKDLLTKFFDLPQTGIDHFLSLEDIKNPVTFDDSIFKDRLCIGGFDLSQTTDLTSATIIGIYRGDASFISCSYFSTIFFMSGSVTAISIGLSFRNFCKSSYVLFASSTVCFTFFSIPSLFSEKCSMTMNIPLNAMTNTFAGLNTADIAPPIACPNLRTPSTILANPLFIFSDESPNLLKNFSARPKSNELRCASAKFTSSLVNFPSCTRCPACAFVIFPV